jgi:homoserine O-acetyltransferase
MENAGKVFEAGDVALQSGATLRDAKLVYSTHGTLRPRRDNVILFPTRFYGTHADNEFLIGRGKALDPEKYFIVVPGLFGNGLSSSPSNIAPPYNAARFPHVTIYDNVMVQRRLLKERYGVERLALATGWSMGAQQAYHWAALFPECVDRLAPICGSARTSPHNHVFLEGVKAALTADTAWRGGWYRKPPSLGLRAMARCWAGWALSQSFYREGLYRRMGYTSVEDFLVGFWEGLFLQRDANNMLAQIWTWQNSDLSANSVYNGNFERALNSIKARAIVMPAKTDLYFPPEDSCIEVSHMKYAELRVIPSIWGHYAGGAANPQDVVFVDQALRELLAKSQP